MDPLSDVLRLSRPQSYASGGYGLPRHTAVQWPVHEGIKCYAIVSGECWLRVEGVAETMRLLPGDCVVLPPGPPFCMATDPEAKPVEYTILLQGWRSREAALSPEEASCYFFGGHFALTGDPARLLLRSLPPVVHLRSEADRAAMRWSLDRMQEEMRSPRPGSDLLVQQLAYLLLVQALRLHLAELRTGNGSWLAALADPQLCAAIGAVHSQPEFAWTLRELAERACMSRSIFAVRFKEVVGEAPMEYVTRWRMLLAADRLRTSSGSVSEIASAVGYQSESAFGKAFRKATGSSPRMYARRGAAG